MKSEPGTYALILRNFTNALIQIGLWRQIEVKPGYYIYIGSAFGPGGLQARVLRHYRRKKSNHWHIDYLREFMNPNFVWYSFDSERLEHKWAHILSEMNCMSPVEGFGCSDCNCYSHLFHTSTEPDLDRFSNMVSCEVKSFKFFNLQTCRTASSKADLGI